MTELSPGGPYAEACAVNGCTRPTRRATIACPQKSEVDQGAVVPTGHFCPRHEWQIPWNIQLKAVDASGATAEEAHDAMAAVLIEAKEFLDLPGNDRADLPTPQYIPRA